jgi:DNA-directed RNA polymerase sigma subunit (sigma70/sigma32)
MYIKMSSKTLAYFKSFIQNSKLLGKKEKDILIRRLGKKTLKKIARRYKLSDERIRQIEKEALIKFHKKNCQMILLD